MGLSDSSIKQHQYIFKQIEYIDQQYGKSKQDQRFNVFNHLSNKFDKVNLLSKFPFQLLNPKGIIKKYLFLLLLFIQSTIWAQSTYEHEVYEDSDGNPIGGFVSLVIVFGLIYLIDRYRRNVKESKKNVEKEGVKRKIATSVAESSLDRYKDISIFQNKTAWRKGYINAMYDIQNNITRNLFDRSIADLIREYHIKHDLGLIEADKIMEEIGYFEHLEHNNKALIKADPFNGIVVNELVSNSLSVQSNNAFVSKSKGHFILHKDNKEEDFINKCVAIYGDYAEIISGLCLSIKEDGEYRIIKSDDARYKPLYDYIFITHKDHNSPVNKFVGNEFVYYYLESRLDTYPLANAIENHGTLEKEFFGGKIIALEAFYCDNFFLPNVISLGDYILALGHEASMYLHKYIKTPMDYAIYYDLRVMQIQGMTLIEYKEYRKKAGQWHEEDEGWFDGWWGNLGKTRSEARENYDKKQGFTYQNAIDEITNIEWHF